LESYSIGGERRNIPQLIHPKIIAMKKNIILILLLVILGILAFYLLKQNSGNYSDLTKDRLFKVEDINTVQKISLKHPKYPTIVFNKDGQTWKMNNGAEVSEFTFNDFLSLLQKVEVNYIPAKSMTEAIKKDLPKNGIDIKIWDTDGNLIRDYIVGSEMADASGTPFMVRGANQPYVMRIPGFVGSIRTRLVKEMNEWESKDIYTYSAEDIQSVDVFYHRDENASFKIQKNGDQYEVLKHTSSEPTGETNQKTVKAYLDRYSYIIAEYNDSENPEKENIKSHPIFATITLQLSSGETSKIDFYSYSDIAVNTETKSPKDIHPSNKFFADMSNGEFMLVQQRVIWPIFRTYDYFFGN
jgi:uncharacterized protein YxeA